MRQDAREIHAAIAHDRAELAGTVEALVRKTNLKARAKDAVSRQAAHFQRRVSGAVPGDQPEPAGARRSRPAAAYALVAFATGVLAGWRLTRRSYRFPVTAPRHPRARTLAKAAGLAVIAELVDRAVVRPLVTRTRHVEQRPEVAGEAVVIGMTPEGTQASDGAAR